MIVNKKSVDIKGHHDGTEQIEKKGNGVISSGAITKQQVSSKVQPEPNLLSKEKKVAELKLSSNQNQQKENYFNEQLKAQMNSLVTNINKQEKRLEDIVQDPKKKRDEFSNEHLKQQINSIINNVEKQEKRLGKEERLSKHDTILSTAATDRDDRNLIAYLPEKKRKDIKKNITPMDVPEPKSNPLIIKKDEEQK